MVLDELFCSEVSETDRFTGSVAETEGVISEMLGADGFIAIEHEVFSLVVSETDRFNAGTFESKGFKLEVSEVAGMISDVSVLQMFLVFLDRH